MDSTSDAIAYFHEGLHVYANHAWLDALHAASLEELEALSLLDIAHSDEHEIKSLVREFSHGKFPDHALPMTIRSPGHGEFSATLTFSPVRFNAEESVQVVLQKSGGAADVEAEIRRLKSQDALTGLLNRNAFMDQLQLGLDSNSADRSNAVYCLQPDDFHAIEKMVSVQQADSLIKSMSRVLRSTLKDSDRLGRFTDHVFAIFAERDNRAELRALADTLRESIEQFLSSTGTEDLPSGCSVGLVMVGPQTNDAEQVIANTRTALEQAVEEGNQVVRYHPSREEMAQVDGDQNWEKRIRYALNNDDFYSVQQSIVNLEGDTEGLFENRTFLHEDNGDLAPEEFMTAAEGYNLASTIDRQIIPGLLKAIAGTEDRHIINLSGNSVHDFSFPAWFQRQLQENEVEGSQVILQIPVDSAVAHMRAARRLFDEMKPQVCGFALSGFDGRRQANEVLDQLDVTLVKLKSELTEQLKSNLDNQNMIRNVVSCAEHSDVQVLADNVVDSSDMATLWQCGVKLVAGEFLQRSPRVIGQ
jgi:diguanylate cyclase (GGDEF)-like protein